MFQKSGPPTDGDNFVVFAIYSSFQRWKNFENQLGFDKVITISWVIHFLGTKSIQGGSKSKLLIFSEYANNTEKIGGTWTNTNNYRENEALSGIYFTIVLCLNILWLKAVNDITADYTTRQLRNMAS